MKVGVAAGGVYVSNKWLQLNRRSTTDLLHAWALFSRRIEFWKHFVRDEQNEDISDRRMASEWRKTSRKRTEFECTPSLYGFNCIDYSDVISYVIHVKLPPPARSAYIKNTNEIANECAPAGQFHAFVRKWCLLKPIIQRKWSAYEFLALIKLREPLLILRSGRGCCHPTDM